jgi:tetratricopeptide (TPR) repeat protein
MSPALRIRQLVHESMDLFFEPVFWVHSAVRRWCRASSNKPEMAHAHLIEEGSAEYEIGRVAEAIRIWQTALLRAREAEDDLLVARSQSLIGLGLVSVHRFSDAVTPLSEALTLLEAQDESDDQLGELARVGNGLAAALDYAGNPEASLDLFQRAIEWARRYDALSAELCDVLHNYAKLVLEQGEIDAAREAFSEALRANRDRGDTRRQADCIAGIAHMEQSQGHLDQALSHYKHAQDLYMSVEHAVGHIQCIGNIAGIHFRRGSLDSAAIAYRNALKMSQDRGLPHVEATTLGGLGNVLILKGQIQDARECFYRALTIGDSLREPGLISSGYGSLGISYSHGDPALLPVALHCLVLAYGRSQAAQNLHGAATSQVNIGIVVYRLGNPERAIGVLQAAIEIFEILGDPLGVANALANAAVAAARMGRQVNSIEMLTKARSLYHEIGGRPRGLVNVEQMLRRIEVRPAADLDDLILTPVEAAMAA